MRRWYRLLILLGGEYAFVGRKGKVQYFLPFNISTKSNCLRPEDEHGIELLMKKGLGHNHNIRSKTDCIVGNVGESRAANQQGAFVGCSVFLAQRIDRWF